MQTTGPIENGLRRTQHARQPMNDLRIHCEAIPMEDGASAGVDRLNGGLAADAATRAHVEVTFETFDVAGIGRRLELDAHGIVSCRFDLRDVGHASDDALAKQEPGGKFEVVPRSPHRNRYRLIADADFERLFDSDEILLRFGRGADYPLHRNRQNISLHLDPRPI